MPKAFRESAVGQLARETGVSESGLRRWMAQAHVAEGACPGLTRSESAELAALRRRNRVLEREVEILQRASAYFGRENVRPK